MPAKSKAQQQAAGAALAAKRGEIKASALKAASRGMYQSMSEAELEEFASTPLKGKPARIGAKPKARRSVVNKRAKRSVRKR